MVEEAEICQYVIFDGLLVLEWRGARTGRIKFARYICDWSWN